MKNKCKNDIIICLLLYHYLLMANHINYLEQILRILRNDYEWIRHFNNGHVVNVVNINKERDVLMPYIKINKIYEEFVDSVDFVESVCNTPRKLIYDNVHLEISIFKSYYFPFTGKIIIRNIKINTSNKNGFLKNVKWTVTKDVYSQSCTFIANRIIFDKTKLINELIKFDNKIIVEIGV